MSDLASRIEAVRKTPSTVLGQELLATFSGDLAKLNKSLLDAIGLLPAYDQRKCELVRLIPSIRIYLILSLRQRLQALEVNIESLRSTLAPKARFSFKRNPAKQSPSPAVSTVITQGGNTPPP